MGGFRCFSDDQAALAPDIGYRKQVSSAAQGGREETRGTRVTPGYLVSRGTARFACRVVLVS